MNFSALTVYPTLMCLHSSKRDVTLSIFPCIGSGSMLFSSSRIFISEYATITITCSVSENVYECNVWQRACKTPITLFYWFSVTLNVSNVVLNRSVWFCPKCEMQCGVQLFNVSNNDVHSFSCSNILLKTL